MPRQTTLSHTPAVRVRRLHRNFHSNRVPLLLQKTAFGDPVIVRIPRRRRNLPGNYGHRRACLRPVHTHARSERQGLGRETASISLFHATLVPCNILRRKRDHAAPLVLLNGLHPVLEPSTFRRLVHRALVPCSLDLRHRRRTSLLPSPCTLFAARHPFSGLGRVAQRFQAHLRQKSMVVELLDRDVLVVAAKVQRRRCLALTHLGVRAADLRRQVRGLLQLREPPAKPVRGRCRAAGRVTHWTAQGTKHSSRTPAPLPDAACAHRRACGLPFNDLVTLQHSLMPLALTRFECSDRIRRHALSEQHHPALS